MCRRDGQVRYAPPVHKLHHPARLNFGASFRRPDGCYLLLRSGPTKNRSARSLPKSQNDRPPLGCSNLTRPGCLGHLALQVLDSAGVPSAGSTPRSRGLLRAPRRSPPAADRAGRAGASSKRISERTFNAQEIPRSPRLRRPAGSCVPFRQQSGQNSHGSGPSHIPQLTAFPQDNVML